jgi:hypothetical protein
METQPEKCARLITALEDLALREAALLRVGDFTEAAVIQGRAAPLVDFIAAAATAAAGSELQARIAGLVGLRNKSIKRLGSEIETARAELTQMQTRERTVAQVAPAYGSRFDSARRYLCGRG